MTVLLGGAQGSRTQTEELILRFKTARPMGLLLVTSADSNSPDRLEIALTAGRIRASVRLGERVKVGESASGSGVVERHSLNAQQFWHLLAGPFGWPKRAK